MSIELFLIVRKIKKTEPPTYDYGDRLLLDEINKKLDTLFREIRNGNNSSFGKDVAGDHDY